MESISQNFEKTLELESVPHYNTAIKQLRFTKEKEKGKNTMDYQQIAADIIQAVGGSENIRSAMHCATRLRLRLKDYDKVDTARLEDVDQVKGVFLANDQQQVILGSGTVNLVTAEVLKLTGLGAAAPAEEEPAEKKETGSHAV